MKCLLKLNQPSYFARQSLFVSGIPFGKKLFWLLICSRLNHFRTLNNNSGRIDSFEYISNTCMCHFTLASTSDQNVAGWLPVVGSDAIPWILAKFFRSSSEYRVKRMNNSGTERNERAWRHVESTNGANHKLTLAVWWSGYAMLSQIHIKSCVDTHNVTTHAPVLPMATFFSTYLRYDPRATSHAAKCYTLCNFFLTISQDVPFCSTHLMSPKFDPNWSSLLDRDYEKAFLLRLYSWIS